MAAKLIQDVRPVRTVPVPRPLEAAKHEVAGRIRSTHKPVHDVVRPLPHLAPYRPPAKPDKPDPIAQPPVGPAAPAPAVQPVPEPQSAPRLKPPARRQPRPKTASPWRHRVVEAGQYVVIIVAALVAANNTTLGQWMVLAYAVYAIVRGLKSQTSFGAALFLLVAIPVFQLLGQAGVAQNLAIYVYELLVVGTVQAIIELYKSRHKSKPAA